MTEPYSYGGVVYSDQPTGVRIELGERVITVFCDLCGVEL